MKNIRFTILLSQKEKRLLDALSWKYKKYSSEILRWGLEMIANNAEIYDGEEYMRSHNHGAPYPWLADYEKD